MRKHNRDITKRLIEYSKVHVRNHMIEGRFKGWHLKHTVKDKNVSDNSEIALSRKKNKRAKRLKDLGLTIGDGISMKNIIHPGWKYDDNLQPIEIDNG